MKCVFRALRVAALFVGSVVGAGFATGQEVQLFFGGDGVASLIVASLFMAVCAFFFMEIGAKRLVNARASVATDTLVSVCSFAVYAAMIAAAEELLVDVTGQAGLSALVAVTMMAFGKRTASLSLFNLVAVPLMIVVIALVGVRSTGAVTGRFGLLTPLAYGGMNLLFSGALMVKEGETSTHAERVFASVLLGAAVFAMLYFMRRAVAGVTGDMPFLTAAVGANVGTVANLSLLLAIVTTMGACAHLTTSRLAALVGDGALAAPLVVLLGIVTSSFGFAAIVEVSYPIVSYLGLAATLFAVALPAVAFFKRGGFGKFFRPKKLVGGLTAKRK